ncbi:MAG: DUF1501 domain-containing protein [Candidatus Thiodiazotropha sp.]|jgi:uncharacterized protein (DUF1501 family)
MAMQRRDFLKALAGIGGINVLGAAGQLPFIRNASAAAPNFNDYKALVCIFLYGGNDTFNMLVPMGSDPLKGYDLYAKTRGGLAVKNVDLGLDQITTNGSNLNQGVLGSAAANPYNVNFSQSSAYKKGVYPLTAKNINLGVNGVMPELAQLFMDNKATILANTGTLVRPVTRSEIKAGDAELPLFLFAHNHQQRELQTGQANNLNDIGWAGKIADNWNNINQGNPLGLNISYAGNDRMLIGKKTSPLVLKVGTPPYISHLKEGIRDSNDDRHALFTALAGIQASTDRLDFNAANTPTTQEPFKDLYNRKLLKSLSTFDKLNQSWSNLQLDFTTTGPYGEALFDTPTQQQLGFSNPLRGELITQLEAVSKMIHLGASGGFGEGYNRQIFFVQLSGFDNHASQAADHPRLLRELSLGLWKFQKAMEELGYADQVTSFTMSDFGRTLSYNGDGTDHAWGAHQLVIGGNGKRAAGHLNGGKLIGELPSLELSGDDDYSNKGRIIPTMAQDQVNAALTQWLGADQSLINSIFPNLSNFQTTEDLKSAYAKIFV